jgi:hypothetical protein
LGEYQQPIPERVDRDSPGRILGQLPATSPEANAAAKLGVRPGSGPNMKSHVDARSELSAPSGSDVRLLLPKDDIEHFSAYTLKMFDADVRAAGCAR